MMPTIRTDDVTYPAVAIPPAPASSAAQPIPSADAYIGEINAALNRIEKADGAIANGERSALVAAIDCGRLLSLAKENVEATQGKRKWKSWLELKFPKIAYSTAKHYMALAEHESLIADCPSIRKAIAMLPKKAPPPEEDDHKANAVSPIEQKPPKTRRAQRGLGTGWLYTPDEVFKKLQADWDRDQLRALTKLLAEYLQQQAALANA